MNRILLSAIFLFSFSACKQKAQTVVVAGDSWGFFVCNYKSLDKAFERAGLIDVGTNATCPITTRTGVRAEGWMGSIHDKSTVDALKDKSVKVLFLSLGGNDLMNHWTKSMTLEQTTEVFTKIKNEVAKITQKYRQLRPDIKILVTGYDYPHFTPNHPVPLYKEAYESMGSPEPVEMNSALVLFTQIMAELHNPSENIFFIHHLGLMHYHFGNSKTGLAPQTTLRPELISSRENPAQIGGDIRHQSDVLGMLFSSSTGIVDAFHLSRRGYDRLADHSLHHYLYDWLTAP